MFDSENTAFVSVNFVQEIRIVNSVHLESRRIFLYTEQILELLEIVQAFNVILVFLLIDNSLAWIVAFDQVLEAPVVSQ